jgi:predicted dehydrogenase
VKEPSPEARLWESGPLGLGDPESAAQLAEALRSAGYVEKAVSGALGVEVDHFVRCVRGETEPACTAHDGTEAVRIALAMEAAADANAPVDLPSLATGPVIA